MKPIVMIFTLIALNCFDAAAIPTTITVRVKSKDAKFIGSSMGGVLVSIKNVDTGEILSKGLTVGTTGDTTRIMKTPLIRGGVLSDDRSAKFTATIDIEDPTFIEVTAVGPMAQRQSSNKVSITQWVIPGKDITTGDALLLELPGFVVDILSPPAHIKYSGSPQLIQVKVNVTMMCGCPVRPSGIWNSNNFIIEAVIKKNGEKITTIPLDYAGEISQFSVGYTALAPGTYDIFVYALDSRNGNSGLDRTTFIIQ